jgi:DNA invertase Pin-like site-specific DNA recombinase
MISERTKAALQAAKARGVRLGNPELATAAQIGHAAQSEIARQKAENVRPIIDQIIKSGVKSLNGIAASLSARGVKTARGGTRWHATQVATVLRLTGVSESVYVGPARTVREGGVRSRTVCPSLSV